MGLDEFQVSSIGMGFWCEERHMLRNNKSGMTIQVNFWLRKMLFWNSFGVLYFGMVILEGKFYHQE